MGYHEGVGVDVIDGRAQPLPPCEQTWLKLMGHTRLIQQGKMRVLSARMPRANAITLALTARILDGQGLW